MGSLVVVVGAPAGVPTGVGAAPARVLGAMTSVGGAVGTACRLGRLPQVCCVALARLLSFSVLGVLTWDRLPTLGRACWEDALHRVTWGESRTVSGTGVSPPGVWCGDRDSW